MMSAMEQSLTIRVGDVALEADVVVPEGTRGVVLFAHGSGSGRHSPRNRFVAGRLQDAGLATVLADLLTREEELLEARTAHLRFDIGLLAARVNALTDWIPTYEPARGLGIGLFGASTGAAAALVTAAERAEAVKAVVSRGGRPDLAGSTLRSVHQPTLLIVGSLDQVVIELNQKAMEQIPGETRLEIVPGASHLFEEPGALEQVAELARDWFVRTL
jgi:pimeloyl-ACP methyl ester carboxylesterase